CLWEADTELFLGSGLISSITQTHSRVDGGRLRFPLQILYLPQANAGDSLVNQSINNLANPLAQRNWYGVVVLEYDSQSRQGLSNCTTNELSFLTSYFLSP
ncbi:hypothetical protein CPB86DRAFT_719369, partial [Serendipita vermifera]